MTEEKPEERPVLAEHGREAFTRVVDELIRLCQRDGLLPTASSRA